MGRLSEGYRSDIDGLRAIAVTAVVLFHAAIPGFSGGFVGVDIFFVISGFLITSIIAPEIDTNSFSIARFYQRRVRRIFPALIFVILASAGAGYVLLTPSDYARLGASIAATSLFVSNVFFWKQIGYFAAPASANPLLHTWSLSVEEQFYLLYPLTLLLLSWLGPRKRVMIILAITVGSFVFCSVLVYLKPNATFFLGPTRAWELLSGALISLGVFPQLRGNLVQFLGIGGLVLICGSIAFLTSTTPFPGIAALAPVCGAAMLIWSGMSPGSLASKLLSATPFVSVGRASYSFYLWHFPIFSFYEYATLGRPDMPRSLILAGVALGMAYLSLHLVENPFRFSVPKTKINKAVAAASVAMATLCVSGLVVRASDGMPWRLDPASALLLSSEGDRDRHHRECMSEDTRIVLPRNSCKLGDHAATPHVILWGDSHAMVTATAMEAAARRQHASFLFSADADCPIGIGFSIDSRGPSFVSSPSYRYCQTYNEEMLRLVERPDIDTVVLSSRWTKWSNGQPGSPAEGFVDIRLRDSNGVAQSLEDNERIFEAGFRSLIARLTAAQKAVWIVGPVPEASTSIPKALFLEHLGFAHKSLEISWRAYLRRNEAILSFFNEFAEQERIKFIWPATLLCRHAECPVVEAGRALFLDDNHLSHFGASRTSVLYDKIFRRTNDISSPTSSHFDR